ncbi:MAG: TM1812 family CRISPR-associated protein [Candidatus Nitrosocaldaceae archaeon]
MLIYQILGKLAYSEVIFTLENKDYERKKLSSEALYNHYTEKNQNIENIILLKPESLITNNSSTSIIDNNIVDVKAKERTEIIPIQAVGTYNNIRYNGTPTNISLQIFADMIRRSIDKNCTEIIIDLSTGYNLYVLSLFEAARFYTTYMRLLSNNDRHFVSYAISEHVLSANVKYKIYVEKLQTRTTFDLPEYHSLTDCIETNDDNKEIIGRKFSCINTRLKKIYANLRLAYNAIIYNTPLFLFSNCIDSGDESNNRKIVMDLCNFLDEILKDWKDIELKRSLYNLFLIVAMHNGIRYMLKDLVNKIDDVQLDNLKKFKSIYENLNLNLNWRLLDNAISEIECYKGCIPEEWKSYKEIMKSRLSNKALREGVENLLDDRNNRMKQSNSKRNFFAHAGLSYDTLQLRLDNGNILCRYDKEKIKEIQEWIKKP